MCWAAAASNVLAWTKWGFPPIQSFDSETLKYFQDHWMDTYGDPQKAWEWWFNGINDENVRAPGGGFWKESQYAFDESYHVEWDRTKALLAIDHFLRSGYGVVLQLLGQYGGHYITCWGYGYDNQNNYLGIYVNHSDDDLRDQPRYYELSETGWSYPGWWYFQYFPENSIEYLISEVHALDRFPGVPSPPTGLRII